MKLAQVVLDIPVQSLDTPYTYVVSHDEANVEIGCAVLVPFGPRKAVGFVVSIEEVDEFDDSVCACASEGSSRDDSRDGDALEDLFTYGSVSLDETLPSEAHYGFGAQYDVAEPKKNASKKGGKAGATLKLKSIERVLSKPYFDEEGAACAEFLSQRYIAPLSSCVRLFTPPGGVPRIVQAKAGYWRVEEPAVGEVDDRWVTAGALINDFAPRKNAVKQHAILEAVKSGDVRVSELSLELGSIGSALKALEEKGAVRVELRRRMRSVERMDAGFVPTRKPELTEGQKKALEAIDAAREAACGEVVLIDGVTGSGKTEVYLQAIERTLGEGRTAIVLVPEISLTPQTVARFRGRFGDMVAVMHSRMSQGERYDQWDYIRSGEARLVVGARSALFTPMQNVGLIVIDEEHEGSYKQDSSPRYVARDVAEWMVQRTGGVLVLGSATPSIEALYQCNKNPHWHLVAMPERANGRSLPEVEVIDMASEFKSGSRAMFSGRLLRGLQEELARGCKVVLLLNQRGFAKFLLCRDCGYVPECPSCSTSLTYHEQGSKLVCHHCNHEVAAPAVCPKCQSPYLRKFGAGTQRVEAELRAVLDAMPNVGPSVPIIRMDADTTKGKGAHQRLLEQFGVADAAVLLGTQMIAKGLDFEDVTLVGVINADTQLNLPDYRAGERTFALIEQVAGRAGRAELPGRVMVQTYAADAVSIRAAASYDRAMFLRSELPKRKILGYPPYVRMVNVLVWGEEENEVRAKAEELRGQIVALVRDFGSDDWRVLPAAPCVLEKLRNVYRWHVVVKAPHGADLSGVLARLLRSRKADPKVNVVADVDPNDLL